MSLSMIGKYLNDLLDMCFVLSQFRDGCGPTERTDLMRSLTPIMELKDRTAPSSISFSWTIETKL